MRMPKDTAEKVPFTHAHPERWVEEYGDCLYRYALLRVRQPEIAEDLVQDTFLAAVRTAQNFRGQSAERSWLCGILKNKICDYFRKLGRETPFSDLEFLADELSHKFVPQGYWNHEEGPLEWKPEVEVVMHRTEFWEIMTHCLSRLPKRIADVFMLREIDELKTDEICQYLNITPNNLCVMLHRARMALRECLETNWYKKVSAEAK
jgi:RNA polymerase sigma-70 factor (TIGR02943 family)